MYENKNTIREIKKKKRNEEEGKPYPGKYIRSNKTMVKVKVMKTIYSPEQALWTPGVLVSQNRYMKIVRLSALRTGHLYPHEITLVLIYVRD